MAEQFNEAEWEEDTGVVTSEIEGAWAAEDNGSSLFPFPGTPQDVQAAQALAAELEGEYEPDKIGRLDYLFNQAKLGVGDSASLLNAIIETVVVDPAQALAWYAGLAEKPPAGSPISNFFEHLTESQKAAASITGADTSMKAPDVATQLVGGAVRAVADPANIALPGSKAIALTTAAAAGTGGEAGGMLGEQVGKKLGAPEVGSTLGSLLGAATGGSVSVANRAAVSSAVSLASDFRKKVAAYKDAPETMAAGKAQRFMARVEQEMTQEGLNSMVDDFVGLRYIVGGEDIPLFVAMADNPAIRASVVNLVKTDPNVRAAVQKQVNILAQKVNDKADAFFGSRYVATDGTLVDISNVSKRVIALDQQINKISEGLEPGRTAEQTGAAISNLVQARAAAVRSDMQPKYDELTAQARANKVTMPATGTEAIYSFVRQNNIRDIFGKGTAVDKQILSKFAPDAKGAFASVSFDTVDSLKREINRLQRGRLNPDESRRLTQLEEVVDEARKGIPGDYNRRLIDLDREYYLRLGVPFGEQGIKDIDAKKYAEQIAPVIASKPSAMRQFLRAVGPDGYSVASDAVMSKVYHQFVKDGVLNSAGLRKYIRDNKATLSQVPGLVEKLEGAASDVSKLQLTRSRLDTQAKEAEKTLANNFLSKADPTLDYNNLASRAMNEPAYMSKLLTDVKATSPASAKAVVNSIRREVIEIAMSSPEGMVNYLTNPKRAYQIDQLFGTQYRGLVMDMGRMHDALQRADVSKVTDSLSKADLERAVAGLKPSTTISVLRDRITSFTQKIAILASRAATAKIEKSDKDAMIELLIDPKGLERLAGKKKAGVDLKNPINVAKMYRQYIDALPVMFYTPAKQEMYRQEEQRR